MSTANKNYPLINETDSNGNPLNAYDQLVTESNNFRRAVDTDINALEQNIYSVHQQGNNTQNINTVFTNMENFSTTRIYGYSADTSRGHPVTRNYAYWVCTITRMDSSYGQAIFTTSTQSYVGGWNYSLAKFTWRLAVEEKDVSLAHPSNRLTFTPNSSAIANDGLVVASNGELLTITGYLAFKSAYEENIGVKLGSINMTVIRNLPFIAYNRSSYLHKELMINSQGEIFLRNDDRPVKGGDYLNFGAVLPIF